MSDIKQKAREMFDEKFGCAVFDKEECLWGDSIGRNAGCDDCNHNKEIRQEHKDFIDQIIDLAKAEERKRVVEMIENHNWGATERTKEMYDGFAKNIINLITNTNK